MALISQADLEARLGNSLSTEQTTAFTIMNAAMQAYVEGIIGSGVEEVSESTRYYDGGLHALKIDPCTNIASVKLVDEDNNESLTIDTSNYTTEPVNETLKTMLRYRYGKFNYGINNIAVAAKFSVYGDVQVRNTVKDAILEALEAEIGNNKNINKESIEGYSVEYASTEARAALNKLRYKFANII